MPDRMTPTSAVRARRRGVLPQVLEPLLVVLVFAAAGAGGGWLWERWWTPIRGVVVDGTWIAGYRAEGDAFVFDFPSLEGFFAGTAQYVVIGLVAGAVLGAACALLGRRSELVMLLAVVVGSAVAGLVAYRLGTALGPVDPTTLEAARPDGTILPSELSVPGASPFVAWPLGALLGLAAVYLLTTAGSATGQAVGRQQERERWLPRSDGSADPILDPSAGSPVDSAGGQPGRASS
jgi:hypothetical protein